MKNFSQDDQKVSLSSEIKKQFNYLTNTQLRESIVYPDIICGACEAEFLKFYVFKYFLIKNQEMLIETFAGLDEDREIGENFLNPEGQMASKIKQETVEDPNEQSEEKREKIFDFQEEFLQIDIKTDPDESKIFDENMEENESDSDFEKPPKKLKRKVPLKTGTMKAQHKSSANDYKKKRKDRVNSNVFCDYCGREFSGCTSNKRVSSKFLKDYPTWRIESFDRLDYPPEFPRIHRKIIIF